MDLFVHDKVMEELYVFLNFISWPHFIIQKCYSTLEKLNVAESKYLSLDWMYENAQKLSECNTRLRGTQVNSMSGGMSPAGKRDAVQWRFTDVEDNDVHAEE